MTEQQKLNNLKYKVTQELSLLENGLIALKKSKVHITEDHLERVIYNLKELCK